MAKYFDFKTARRHFHFVAFRFNIRQSIQGYWRDCGVQVRKEPQFTSENDLFRIEQQSLISNRQYFTGGRDYSLNGNGQAPYQYDLIAVEVKEQNILVVGYPFKYLAKEIVDSLIKDKKYLTKASFVKPNLDKLLSQSMENDFTGPNYECHFSSLGLTLTGDKNMTSIDFGGDRPLDSPIYKSLFKNVIQKKQSIMENCTLKCEIRSGEDSFSPKTRGNVHIDHFGNLKIYIHGSGKNIFVMPYVLTLLKKFKCIETTLNNPLLHLEDE